MRAPLTDLSLLCLPAVVSAQAMPGRRVDWGAMPVMTADERLSVPSVGPGVTLVCDLQRHAQ